MVADKSRRAGRTVALAATLLISSAAPLAVLATPAGAAGGTASTTSVSSSAPAGSALAAAVTYTATVAPTSGTGATPTGSVAFTDHGTILYDRVRPDGNAPGQICTR